MPTIKILPHPEYAPNGAEVQGLLGTSEDGSYIYFAANGVLAPGAGAGSCKTYQPLGACSIYLWHEDQLTHESSITFIARVEPGVVPPDRTTDPDSDQANWSPTSFVAPSGGGVEQNAGRVTGDGHTLLFRSTAQLTDYDNHGYAELYRYRVGDSAPTCISCNPTNSTPTGSAALQDIVEKFTGPKLSYPVRTRNLSADGQRVFFETPDRLLSADINGVSDVYEWEADGSGSCHSEAQNGGCLFLLSTGASPLPSHFGDASANGVDVFILTAQSLVRQDRDELFDVYDVRVGGGIALQNQAEPPVCQGESCAGAATPPPAVPPSGATASGPGNNPRLLCPKGSHRVRKKGRERCVRTKKHGRGKRPAGRNGRSGR